MYNFCVDIVVLMNIMLDYLDWYDYCMQNYINVKFCIMQNQILEDVFIFWNDDFIIKCELDKYGICVYLYLFLVIKEEGFIVYVEDYEVVIIELIVFNMEQEQLVLIG